MPCASHLLSPRRCLGPRRSSNLLTGPCTVPAGFRKAVGSRCSPRGNILTSENS